MTRTGICLAVARLAALTMVAVCVLAAKVEAEPTLYAFGDSLVDTGNVFARYGGQVPPSPPYVGGRFSNGPVFVEVLADRLGMAAPTPSTLGGTNYAFGGARTGSGTSDLIFPGVTDSLPVDNFGLQVANFIGSGGSLGTQDLVAINGGGNNFLDVLLFGATPDPMAWAGELASAVSELANVGGRRFLVANLPLLGQTPLIQGLDASNPGLADQFNFLSSAFNQALDGYLDALEAGPLGLEIFRLDIAAITSAAIADPSRFGLTNVTDPALTPLGLVSDPENYLFWDNFHPTARGHELLGEAAARLVIPEPSSLALVSLGSAFGAAVVIVRRRRRYQTG